MDACLLIAAPDLLHALKYMLEMRQIQCLHTHKGPDQTCAKCVADAAIAKAEGRD